MLCSALGIGSHDFRSDPLSSTTNTSTQQPILSTTNSLSDFTFMTFTRIISQRTVRIPLQIIVLNRTRGHSPLQIIVLHRTRRWSIRCIPTVIRTFLSIHNSPSAVSMLYNLMTAARTYPRVLDPVRVLPTELRLSFEIAPYR